MTAEKKKNKKNIGKKEEKIIKQTSKQTSKQERASGRH